MCIAFCKHISLRKKIITPTESIRKKCVNLIRKKLIAKNKKKNSFFINNLTTVSIKICVEQLLTCSLIYVMKNT